MTVSIGTSDLAELVKTAPPFVPGVGRPVPPALARTIPVLSGLREAWDALRDLVGRWA